VVPGVPQGVYTSMLGYIGMIWLLRIVEEAVGVNNSALVVVFVSRVEKRQASVS
jgi:hypothetical protein